MNISLLLVDDHPLFRIGVINYLKLIYPEILIIEAENGQQAVDLYFRYRPNIVLMDYSMPRVDGYEASAEILKGNKSARIILLTMFDSIPIALNFLKLGGRGFLTKNCQGEDIINAIRVVSCGDYYFHSSYEKEIIEKLDANIQSVPKVRFTALELQIIVKTSKGLTIKEISQELHLSARTVESYRYSLLRKTGVNNSMELIDFVYRNGIGFNMENTLPK